MFDGRPAVPAGDGGADGFATVIEIAVLEDAGTELGRLDGIAKVIPDPDFFVSMYVRREAVLSSQIEGTPSASEDLLARELDQVTDDRSDVLDIVN